LNGHPSPTHDGLSWNDETLLGLIELSTSVAMSAEAPDALPPGVNAVFTRMRLPGGEVSARALEAMTATDRLEHATRELADGGADVVAFACTTGSLVKGAGFDRELVARMEAAAPVRATTTATALLAALAALGVERVAVATPYIDELNQLEVAFLEDQGFRVTGIRGMGIGTDPEIAQVPYSRTRDLARAVDDPAADAVFISCTGLATIALLSELEAELGKPVISSNAVTLWHALTLAGVVPSGEGQGSLLNGTSKHLDPEVGR
jgi:maleate isomerase